MSISLREAVEYKLKLLKNLEETISYIKASKNIEENIAETLTGIDNVIETICDLDIKINRCKSSTMMSETETIHDVECYSIAINRKLDILYTLLDLDLDLDMSGVINSISKYKGIRDSIHNSLLGTYSKAKL